MTEPWRTILSMSDDNHLEEAAKCLKLALRQVAKAIAEDRPDHHAYHVNDAIAQTTFALTAMRTAQSGSK